MLIRFLQTLEKCLHILRCGNFINGNNMKDINIITAITEGSQLHIFIKLGAADFACTF